MNIETTVNRFVCRALRGEPAPWPVDDAEEFEQCFLQHADHHGVKALIFNQAHLLPCWESWPDSVREQLAAALRAATAFDLLRAHKVGAFLAELNRREIDFLIIKGDAVARTHYSSTSLRTRCDTDLFIGIKDLEGARTALLESGFEVIPPIYKSHQFVGASIPLGSTSIVFDVHWRILNASRYARVIGFTEALEHSIPLPGMESCRTLGPMDSLLLACMHRKGSENHDQDHLVWLYDIHLLVSSLSALELQEFALKAVRKNMQAECRDGMQKSRSCFATEVSDEVMRTLRSATPEMAWSRRFVESNLGLLADDIYHLPDIHSKLALLKELFLPSATFLLNRYEKRKAIWLPILYVRYMGAGFWERLLLK